MSRKITFRLRNISCVAYRIVRYIVSAKAIYHAQSADCAKSRYFIAALVLYLQGIATSAEVA